MTATSLLATHGLAANTLFRLKADLPLHLLCGASVAEAEV